MTSTVGRGRAGGRGFCVCAALAVLLFRASVVEAKLPAGAARHAADSNVSPAPSVEGFSPAEIRRLWRGKAVKRRFELAHQGDAYQAGLSYRLVDGAPMDVIRALRQPGAIAKVIPYGLSTTTLSENDGVTVMKIAQGKRPVVGKYTVRIKWDLRTYSARFWMDPAYKADIEDIWGTFTAREVRPGVTLVSFGFAFNIRGVASILEGKAQTWGLTTADRLAKYLKKSRTPDRRASRQ